jgi:hypothetical protein
MPGCEASHMIFSFYRKNNYIFEWWPILLVLFIRAIRLLGDC